MVATIGNGYRSTNLKFKSDDEIQTRRITSFDRHMEPAGEPVLESPLDGGVLRTSGDQHFLGSRRCPRAWGSWMKTKS